MNIALALYSRFLVVVLCVLVYSPLMLHSQHAQYLFQIGEKLRFNNPDSARLIFNDLKEYAERTNNADTVLIAVNQIAAIDYIKGDYIRSMEGFVHAFETATTLNNLQQLAYAENGIGLVHLGQLQYKQAISAFELAFEMNKKNADSTNMVKNLFNIGICLRELHRYDEAISYFDNALKFLEGSKKNYLYPMVLNQKAKALYEVKQFNESKKLYQLVFEQKDSLTNWEKTFAHAGLAEINFIQKKFEDARIHATKAYAIANELNTLWDMHRASKILWESEKALGNTKQALEEAQNYILLSDSLFNRDKDMQINAMQFELSDLKNNLLAANLSNAKKQLKLTSWIIFAVSALLIMLFIFIFYYRKILKHSDLLNKKLNATNVDLERKTEQLERSNKAKNQIFSIISHDLRGPVGQILQIMDMEDSEEITQIEKNELRDMLREQVQITHLQMDKLLEWASQQMDGIQFNPDAINLVEILRNELEKIQINIHTKKITLEINTIENAVTNVDPNHLSIILQNLLSNSIKFTPIGGLLQLDVLKKDNKLMLEIKDNGIGMDDKTLERVRVRSGKLFSQEGTLKEKGSGMGLLLSSQLMSMNNIKLEVISELSKGSTFTLIFPTH